MSQGLTRRTFCGSAAFAGASAFASPLFAQSAQTTRMNMGGVLAASHPASTFMADACEAIRKETNGAIDINFIANSALGSEASMYSQIRSGGLEFAIIGTNYLQSIVPVAGMPCLAYAYNDYNTLWAAMNGELGMHIQALLKKVGTIAFTMVDNGFRHTTTSSTPVNTPNDLSGLKIRVPPSQLYTSLFTSLGAAAVNLPLGELYSALQTKVADGMEGSLVNLDALNVAEIQKYCAMTGHCWEGLWIVTSEKLWNSLGSDVRSVVERTFMDFAGKQQKEFARLDAEMEPKLKAKGMTFTRPDKALFREQVVKSGYYKTWKEKFGQVAWSKMEQYTGPLGS
jgi:TRAP-type transport system periplasmic protein